ncbi:MAG TPA: DUF433 domain-containing protein [Puia sp.]|jgi:uncharacterized protein (DUF433 family)|nr:DUF433 domain-containing protein [Puia sp.]
MNAQALIEINPRIMTGKPVIRGTRITVELILEKLATGESMSQILAAYPHINEEQVRAALAFAAANLKADTIYPIGLAS